MGKIKLLSLGVFSSILSTLFFCCFFVSCKEDIDGRISPIKWEVVSSDNLDYKYGKNDVLKVIASERGNVHIQALNSSLVGFNRILIDGKRVEIEDPDFGQDFSAFYEDEYVRIQLNQEYSPNWFNASKKADLTIFVKNTEKKVNYEISLYGYEINTGGVITIDIQ